MKRIVHLSDLHFGRDRPELVTPLSQQINRLAPDLVAISGDLTQRATEKQFGAARAFIDGLTAPTLIVPGNHDVPLHNFLLRIVRPWSRYRNWISKTLEPEVSDDEMIVLGVNTVNPYSWQRGWFGRNAIRRVRDAFADTHGHRIRIVVAHHPMEHLPGEEKRLMRGASRAIRQLGESKTDMLLSGHLHSWRAKPFAMQDDKGATIQVLAGTGLSTRLREEANDFNLIEVSQDTISITRYSTDENARRFENSGEKRFMRGENRAKHP
ncbi:metallophosphoesterase family protein [Qingshengfaniella alkalisoli]|uniref:Metallophosphoesterase n=1 Tax=Qingshengfaniella alkalisoli TaxID=2599296 RepID=A0A5B8J144_9RHOB|nr:metallophosphoesterase [Qingshengfaniella alkalisoli]QDY71614.1 metallophosphoesterase [Qingshengfaniella alkalisoli]